MNKEFVPYEQALALKELGFDEPCFGYCLDNKFEFFADIRFCNTNSEFKFYPTAPTFSQAFRFFRDKYNLSGVSTHQSYEIWNLVTNECFIEVYPLNSFEKAELACLNKLIEIVKTNEQWK